jgi:hypothetical protein
MGWLLADISTTLVVAFAYWTIAVLRDAARALARHRVRRRVTRHVPSRAANTLATNTLATKRDRVALSTQSFATADPHCVRSSASRG